VGLTKDPELSATCAQSYTVPYSEVAKRCF
jgi:hypothetical protein